MTAQIPANLGFLATRRTMLQGLVAVPLTLSGKAHAQNESEKPPVIIPIALNDDRLWTTIQIGDEPEMIGLFDSGSHVDVISAAVARRLRLKSMGPSQLGGLGGSETSSLLQSNDVLIGRSWKREHLWAQSSALLDDRPYKYLIGSWTMLANNGEFDLSRMEWRIHKSMAELRVQAAQPDALAAYQPIEESYAWNGWLYEPRLECEIGGVTGRMLVDTGSPTNFVVNNAMSRRMGLWDSDQPYAPWRLRGFGNQRAMTRLYRVDRARFPTVTLNKPLVMLTDPGKSNPQLDSFDGLIGMRAMQRCSMLFDKDGKKLWLRPNDGGDLPDLRYPYSGLWLEQDKGRIRIEDVGIGSPAAAAGLRAGDAIVNADWTELLKAINGPAGTTVAIETERAGKRSTVQLELKPYL